MELAVPPTLAPGESIVHDECIVYSNDATKTIWKMDDQNEMRPKSNGQSEHVSGFTGAQKGVKNISQERGLWLNGTKLPDACILLDAQPHFVNQKEWSQETIEDAGHQIIFVPKFHPELSFIEIMWGYIKCKLR